MYVYRAMSNTELLNRLKGISTNKTLNKGLNTFEYKNGVDYIHFYKFAQHAFINKHIFGSIVAKVFLDDSIVPPLEYGFYSNVRSNNDKYPLGCSFPMPEIIIDRRVFSNDNIISLSEEYIGPFKYISNEGESLTFTSSKKNFLGIEKIQHWDEHTVYYEYIKSLLPSFDYNSLSLALYLKNIDLDKELMKFAEIIKNENKIIKVKKRKD